MRLITLFLPLLLMATGCSTFCPSTGPKSSTIASLGTPDTPSPIELIQTTNQVALKVLASQRSISFENNLKPQKAPADIIGPGDTLVITLWEAAPAILFSSSTQSTVLGSVSATGTQQTTLPAQMVNKEGEVSIPFIGNIKVAGKTLTQIESTILAAVKGRANNPQVLVTLTGRLFSTATVVGEVKQSGIMPITPKGEKILDAIANAGGTTQPVNKITIQISRKGLVQSIPLQVIIEDPKQNIALQPEDVITAYYQPLSFVALGSIGAQSPDKAFNNEITFESQGIMLSQALGRVGGLNSSLANSSGIFIFRYEDPRALDLTGKKQIALTPDGKTPVIYQFDLSDPATFFIAQNFPMKNKDILYVSTAPLVDVMRFLGMITSILAPGIYVANLPAFQ